MTRQERLLRLARLRGDRAAELIVGEPCGDYDAPTRPCLSRANVAVFVDGLPGAMLRCWRHAAYYGWTEAELRAAWGDR